MNMSKVPPGGRCESDEGSGNDLEVASDRSDGGAGEVSDCPDGPGVGEASDSADTGRI